MTPSALTSCSPRVLVRPRNCQSPFYLNGNAWLFCWDRPSSPTAHREESPKSSIRPKDFTPPGPRIRSPGAADPALACCPSPAAPGPSAAFQTAPSCCLNAALPRAHGALSAAVFIFFTHKFHLDWASLTTSLDFWTTHYLCLPGLADNLRAGGPRWLWVRKRTARRVQRPRCPYLS